MKHRKRLVFSFGCRGFKRPSKKAVVNWGTTFCLQVLDPFEQLTLEHTYFFTPGTCRAQSRMLIEDPCSFELLSLPLELNTNSSAQFGGEPSAAVSFLQNVYSYSIWYKTQSFIWSKNNDAPVQETLLQ